MDYLGRRSEFIREIKKKRMFIKNTSVAIGVISQGSCRFFLFGVSNVGDNDFKIASVFVFPSLAEQKTAFFIRSIHLQGKILLLK